MTNASQQFIKEEGIVQNLSFQDGKTHILKYIKSEVKTVKFQDGPKKGVAYLFTENGEPKKYFTGAVSFIQPMSEVEEDEEIIVQMVKKNVGGQIRSSFRIEKGKSEFKEELPATDEEIPVVEDSDIPAGEEEWKQL